MYLADAVVSRPAAPPDGRRRDRFDAADFAIVAAIFVLASVLGGYSVVKHRGAGGPQYFYQEEFGPAVMSACGRGFANPITAQVPPLAAFLAERVDSMRCADLPDDVPVTELDAFQRMSRYLEATVALVWKITGVSWSKIAVVSGILFGTVAAVDYGLFRLGLSRVFALLGMVPMLTSTTNFMLAPHIRDYAKSPFLLATMLIMGLLVCGPAGPRRVLVLSALAGAVVGLGVGFRTDVFVAIPPFLVTTTLLLPSGVAARLRGIAAAAFTVSFLLIARPVLAGYSQGSNTGHIILLGLMPPFDQPLRIEPSVYEFGSDYNDSVAFSIIDSYASRVRHRSVTLGTAAYDAAASSYLRQIGAVFPADLITRTAAAIRAFPRFFLSYVLYPPRWVQTPAGRAIYRVRARIWDRLAPVAFPAVILTIVLICLRRPRAASLILLVVLAFGGASAVQFNERHFAYLEIVPWWAFGFLAQTAVRRRSWQEPGAPLAITPTIAIVGATVVATAAIIFVSRAYQQRSAAGLFTAYAGAHRTALPVINRDAGAGRRLLSTPEWLAPLPPESPYVVGRFLAVEFRDDLCAARDVPLTVRYEAIAHDLDFSEALTPRLHGGEGTHSVLFIAVYERGNGSVRFRGIEAGTEDTRCIAAVSDVDGLEREPLLLTVMLAPGWRDRRLYQRFR